MKGSCMEEGSGLEGGRGARGMCRAGGGLTMLVCIRNNISDGECRGLVLKGSGADIHKRVHQQRIVLLTLLAS